VRHDHDVSKQKTPEGARGVAGVVKWFDEAEGWGELNAPEVPGGCFVHYSNVQMDGYRALRAGQQVRFSFEEPGFLQDGYRFRAINVWPSN
jgi:CspA family cold shock protein